MYKNPFNLFGHALEEIRENERLIAELMALTGLTREQVIEYYQTHPYSLDFMLEMVRTVGKLSDVHTYARQKLFGGTVVWREIEMPEPTLKDRIWGWIQVLPYRVGYYASYPILWSVRAVWDGVHDAWIDTED